MEDVALQLDSDGLLVDTGPEEEEAAAGDEEAVDAMKGRSVARSVRVPLLTLLAARSRRT